MPRDLGEAEEHGPDHEGRPGCLHTVNSLGRAYGIFALTGDQDDSEAMLTLDRTGVPITSADPRDGFRPSRR